MPKNETVISQNEQAEGGVQVVTQWLGFGWTYLALMASNIRLLGFPDHGAPVTGQLGPGGVTRGTRMAPAPGNRPFSDGYVESSLVGGERHNQGSNGGTGARQLCVINGHIETDKNGAN
jgi:hypothetical protein